MVCYNTEVPEFLADFVAYLQVEKEYPNSSIYTYFLELRLFLRYQICKKQERELEDLKQVSIHEIDLEFMRAIQKKDVVSYLAWQSLEKNIKATTKNRKIACLKSFFRYLVEENDLEQDVMTGISSVKTQQRLPKYLNEEQIPVLLQSIQGKYWQRDRLMILLMLVTGFRVSEVVSLDLDSIQQGIVTVMGKGNKERQVFLPEMLGASLQAYLAVRPQVESKALFLSQRKKRLSKRGLQLLTTQYFQGMGLAGYSCHKLRHTAATQLLKSGTNLRVIQEVLGHGSIRVTEIYTHVNSEDVREAFLSLEERYGEKGLLR